MTHGQKNIKLYYILVYKQLKLF